MLAHNCLNFNFRRSETRWPFSVNGQDIWLEIKGGVEANSGETLGQLALLGVGIARLGVYGVDGDIKAGRLIPVLEEFNPGDTDQTHAVFIGGSNMPTRIRVFVDFIAERLGF